MNEQRKIRKQKILAQVLASVAMFVLMAATLPLRVDSMSSASTDYPSPIAGVSNIDDLIVKVLGVIVQLGAVLVVIFYIWAGFKYVSARGNPGKISEANTILLQTTIGAFMILGAKAIALAIQGTVTDVVNGK